MCGVERALDLTSHDEREVRDKSPRCCVRDEEQQRAGELRGARARTLFFFCKVRAIDFHLDRSLKFLDGALRCPIVSTPRGSPDDVPVDGYGMVG